MSGPTSWFELLALDDGDMLVREVGTAQYRDQEYTHHRDRGSAGEDVAFKRKTC